MQWCNMDADATLVNRHRCSDSYQGYPCTDPRRVRQQGSQKKKGGQKHESILWASCHQPSNLSANIQQTQALPPVFQYNMQLMSRVSNASRCWAAAGQSAAIARDLTDEEMEELTKIKTGPWMRKEKMYATILMGRLRSENVC